MTGVVREPSLIYQAVAASGSYAYAIARTADERGFLHVIDVRDASAPTVIASDEIGYVEQPAIAVYGLHVFVATKPTADAALNQFSVIDVRDPRAPLIVGQADLWSGSWMSMAATSRRVYVTESRDGLDSLWIVDVSDPTNPVATREALGGVDVARFGQFLLVAGGGADGVVVLDARRCDLQDHGLPSRDPAGVSAGD